MKKILVEVYLPSVNKTFDVFIPKKAKVHEAIKMISALMLNLSNGFFKATEETVLCNKETGDIYDINKSIEELKIQNGSKLMLI